MTRKKTLQVLAAALLSIAAVCALFACTANVESQSKSASDTTSKQIAENEGQTSDNNGNTVDNGLSLDGYGAEGALADDNLSLADMLMYAIQDEYLARSEYIAIMNQFEVGNPYANIMKSEETHIGWLNALFDAHAIAIPEDDSAGHVLATSSLLNAAQTGVEVEINNIAMYEKFLEQPLPQDAIDTFTKLRDASKNHLSTFQKQVEKLS